MPLIEKIPLSLEPQRVFNASHFIADFCQKYPDELEYVCSRIESSEYAPKQLSMNQSVKPDIGLACKQLRVHRMREIVIIAWRSILNYTTLQKTLEDLSALADTLISFALSLAHQLVLNNQSIKDDSGAAQSLTVVALGKLGGYELNFSSDIDIFFAYPREFETNVCGKKELASNLFKRIAQKVIRLLSDITEDGFVYRVDLRLRPYGQSGPLVMSFAQLETYYQEQGRDWERYSILKARLITIDSSPCAKLENILRPFVYRRYTDFTILESLRSLKAMMAREEKLKTRQDDIKRGPGGIREAEFLIQSMQLIYGGREKSLQTSSFFDAINRLQTLKHLSEKESHSIKSAYCFLRQLENAIQWFEDKQKHELPVSDIAKEALCYSLGYQSFDLLLSDLNSHRQSIRSQFIEMLGHPSKSDERIYLDKQLKALWMGQMGDIPAQDVLTSLGFKDSAKALLRLFAFAKRIKGQKITQTAMSRIDGFMPVLLNALQFSDDCDNLLLRMLQLLEGIVKRSAYLALLMENPNALTHILKLFSTSKMIVDLVIEHPFLLEVLLDEHHAFHSLSKSESQKKILHHISQQHDSEGIIECLKEFKLKQVLSILSRDVMGFWDNLATSKALTMTAEIILDETLKLAINEMHKKGQKIFLYEHFTIIAYGKLGSYELTYESDLDLVFLHNLDECYQPTILRLAQRIINLLQSRTVGGKLYCVDARLRPLGSAGMLVSHIDTFCDYQRQKAWTWEHQALIKARAICGSHCLKDSFDRLRCEVLAVERESLALYSDIINMLEKLREESNVSFDPLKLKPGGLLEIEFLVQFAVLKWAYQFPKLLQSTNTLELLEAMSFLGIINNKEYQALKNTYLTQSQALLKRVHVTDKNTPIGIELDIKKIMKGI